MVLDTMHEAAPLRREGDNFDIGESSKSSADVLPILHPIRSDLHSFLGPSKFDAVDVAPGDKIGVVESLSDTSNAFILVNPITVTTI